MNEKPKKLTKEEEEGMFQMHLRGATMKEIAESYDVAPRTPYNVAKRNNWEGEKERRIAVAQKKDAMAQNAILDENLKTANSMIYALIQHVDDFMQTSDLQPRVVKDIAMTVETMTKSIERIVRTQAFIDNGGADRTKHESVNHKIDWNELINKSLELKKEHGDAFDEKNFAKDVIDAQFKQKK